MSRTAHRKPDPEIPYINTEEVEKLAKVCVNMGNILEIAEREAELAAECFADASPCPNSLVHKEVIIPRDVYERWKISNSSLRAHLRCFKANPTGEQKTAFRKRLESVFSLFGKNLWIVI